MTWPAAFPEWSKRAYPVAYWYVYKQLLARSIWHDRARTIAEDAVQEAMVKAAARTTKTGYFPSYPAFLEWIKTVARRDAMAIVVAERRHAQIPFDFDPSELSDVRPTTELHEALKDCRDRLDPPASRLIRWRIDEGKTLKVIASLLDLGLTAAWTRVRNALEHIRQCLMEKGFNPGAF